MQWFVVCRALCFLTVFVTFIGFTSAEKVRKLCRISLVTNVSISVAYTLVHF